MRLGGWPGASLGIGPMAAGSRSRKSTEQLKTSHRGQDMEPVTACEDLPLRVLVAERHGLVRAGFRLLLERQDDMTVAADAATADDAVAAARATSPDVVLMDLDLPGGGGID